MKSGQIFSTIFIYVIALIVMAMIFVYGYSAVKSVMGKGEQVLFIQMKTDIVAAIEDVSSDMGRVDKKEIQIPGTYNVVYFIDLAYLDTDKSSADLCNRESINDDYNPVVCDAWTDSNSEAEFPNLFLVHGTSVESFYIGDIQIVEGYKKFRAPRGKITLRLEGVADGRVLLSEWV